MKVLILIMIIASLMIMGVEMDRDSCVDKSRCAKYGYYQECQDCCKNAGHNGGTCMFFKCKCA
uniref:Potassium channel toxin gamma-KTx 1.1 n=1 Tax=Centruroides noxius TaxID=6878 RepID=KGX11_CENNO|nr:RecName: Full=Potassium channel toxin gamma-KTx 1.1; AltName: Full=Ergtoxin; Short=CnErg1; Short=CnErgTx1; Short=ErgTx; Short=ErgTx1; Flags: Precursor [Centruroides noxius]AAO22234.1 ergtoxin-like protein 1 [Centruroides noxius]